MFYLIVVIFVGVGFGVLLCWCLSFMFNVFFFVVLFGMFVVNLFGGYVIGVVVVVFMVCVGLLLEWWLFVIMGFFGGFMMFLIYLVEVMMYVFEGEFGWVLVVVVLYLIGLFVLMVFGMWIVCVWLVVV